MSKLPTLTIGEQGMKLKVEYLILGAGASGLLANYRLNNTNSIIIERGYDHSKTSDYVVFLKSAYSGITTSPIDVKTKNNSSGCSDFQTEYTKKVYGKTISIKQFSEGELNYSKTKGYPLNNAELLSKANVYGNIEATRIDIKTNTLHGKILHLNKSVEIKYGILINTIPIYSKEIPSSAQ